MYMYILIYVYTRLYVYTHQAANLTERLESRIFCSPEKFNNTLADREKKYGKFGWKPDSDPSQLYPGTYYLDAVCVFCGVGAGGGLHMYRCDVCGGGEIGLVCGGGGGLIIIFFTSGMSLFLPASPLGNSLSVCAFYASSY